MDAHLSNFTAWAQLSNRWTTLSWTQPRYEWHFLGALLGSALAWYPERYDHWKTIYNRFNQWSKSEVINIIFNLLLHILDDKKLIDWDAIALDGSNIWALKAAAGAKNIPMTSAIMGWVALEVALVPKSTWRLIVQNYHWVYASVRGRHMKANTQSIGIMRKIVI